MPRHALGSARHPGIDALFRPVPAAGLAAFRILFGLVMCVGLTRFAVHGWIEAVFVEPTFFFKYEGFEWTVVWDRPWLYVHFLVTAAAALLVAVGLFYRVAAAVFFLGFTYVQLLDVTTYLNHYYLVVLLSAWMVALPLHRCWSLDAHRRPELRQDVLPAWTLYLLRFQVGVVYVYASLAKFHPDWLIHAQPLGIWMAARTEIPIIGPVLSIPLTAYVMSWAGFLYDLSIPFALLWRRTRAVAYGAVLVFHFFTWVLFDIGMFPFIMVVATTVFFDPQWPLRRRTQPAGISAPPLAPRPAHRHLLVGVLAVYCAVQVMLPARHWFHPGDVLWNEVGMRFAWKVLVREKNGSLTYHVRQTRSGRTWQVNPLEYLDHRQYSDMSGQPDLIVQLGKHIADDFEQRKLGPVEVRVESWVSLNGRSPALLLNPEIDLRTIGPNSDPTTWIQPSPEGPPLPVKGPGFAGLFRRR